MLTSREKNLNMRHILVYFNYDATVFGPVVIFKTEIRENCLNFKLRLNESSLSYLLKTSLMTKIILTYV